MGLYSDGVDDPSSFADRRRGPRIPRPRRGSARGGLGGVRRAAGDDARAGKQCQWPCAHVGVGMVGKQAAHRSPHDDGAEGKRIE